MIPARLLLAACVFVALAPVAGRVAGDGAAVLLVASGLTAAGAIHAARRTA